MTKINCFIPWTDAAGMGKLATELLALEPVNRVVVMGAEGNEQLPEGCESLETEAPQSSETIRQIAKRSRDADYVLLITSESPVQLGMFALERFVSVAADTGAQVLYADFFDRVGGRRIPHPVIDYQEGSLRDDFDFGPLLFLDAAAMREAVGPDSEDYRYAGLYRLRLRLSEKVLPRRIPEFLCSVLPVDTRDSGRKIFDYVDPANRAIQIEMEQAHTSHLKAMGAYLEPGFRTPSFDEAEFPVEASVIIPVRNREKTIADAVRSVMSQEAGFAFNCIVIDNHSSDGTTAILKELAAGDERIVHLIPGRDDLGIGGCWNLGVHHPSCGKFAVQLDSDDLYIDEHTLDRIVQAFYEQGCAMVIGSYRMCNFDLEEIPPGLIDHREWTPDNGPNNALRINGLGAPRAFYTPVLRRNPIPNVSYGEDYGVGLAISRRYQIGRIYDALYLCRRWEDNSDAGLSVEAVNKHNSYKDGLRSIEFRARVRLNQSAV